MKYRDYYVFNSLELHQLFLPVMKNYALRLSHLLPEKKGDVSLELAQEIHDMNRRMLLLASSLESDVRNAVSDGDAASEQQKALLKHALEEIMYYKNCILELEK